MRVCVMPFLFSYLSLSLCFYSNNVVSCTDPEGCWAIIGTPGKSHFNGVWLAGR